MHYHNVGAERDGSTSNATGYYGTNTHGTLIDLATPNDTAPGTSQHFIGAYELGLNNDGPQAIYEGIIGPLSVPEPASILLLAVGAAAIFGHRYHRARRTR